MTDIFFDACSERSFLGHIQFGWDELKNVLLVAGAHPAESKILLSTNCEVRVCCFYDCFE